MIFSKIRSNNLKTFKELIHRFDTNAFIMVQDTKYVFKGYDKK
jgi:uncharacterized membrane-anchored protein YitT (DUF2179 family)